MFVNAKDYLEQAARITVKLKAMSDQLAYLKSAAEYISPSFDDMPKSSTPNVNRVEETIISIIDFKDKMTVQYKKLDKINAVIDSVEDPLLQNLLVKRYLQQLPWAKVAKELWVSERNVYGLHKTALGEVETVLKNLQSNADECRV